MKKIFSIPVFLLTVGSLLMAQNDETLFSKANVVGGFGGPIFEYGNVDGDFGTTAGGGGGVIIDKFFLGGFGMGGDYGDTRINDQIYNIDMGYGGLWLGYVYPSHKLMHLYTSMRLGWGGVSLNADDEDDDEFEDSNGVFVLTPEVGIELNVFRWFRIAGTAGYRFVNGVDDLPVLDDKDLRSFTFGITLRFGGFGSSSTGGDNLED